MVGDNYDEGLPEFEEDRDLPAVAGASSAQLVVGVIFLLACLAAMYFLVFRKDSVGPTTITSPNPEIEYNANQNSLPPPPPVRVPPPVFAPPEPPAAREPVQARPVYNPQKAQRDKAAIDAEIARKKAELARLQERISSDQLIINSASRSLQVDNAGAPSGGGLAGLLGGQGASQGAPAPTGGVGGNADANANFFDAVAGGEIPTVQATRLENLDKVLPQGTIIKGIMETAVNSDLPGMMRAIASEDVYSFDGSEILIHKGSRIIGRYNSGVRAGQSRIFVIWERIIRPDGVSIKVDSPGTDELGTAGLGGEVDTHFFKRYGSAILLSVLEGAIDYAVAEAQDSDNTTVALGGAGNNVERLANTALQRNLNIPPTIHVDQGTRINIFVSQDLSFAE